MSKTGLVVAAIFITVASVSYGYSQEQTQTPVSTSGDAMDAQGIRNYLLGPGDLLDVRVFGQPDLNSIVEIDGDGNISSLPFLEKPIRAQCRSDKEVQRDIALAYAKYIKNPQVSVRVSERKSRQPATVQGAVRTPMQVMMMREVRLHELLTKAGGWTDRASGTIQIMHTQPEMCPAGGSVFQNAALQEKGSFGMAVFKISDLKLGKEEADPFVRPGDIVIVTEGDPVYVTGAVNAPRELVIRDQLTLSRAIAMASGPQRTAKTSEIHIYRQRDGKPGQDDLKFNYDDIRKGKAADPELKAFDIVEVGQSSALSAKRMGDLLTGLITGLPATALQRGIIY